MQLWDHSQRLNETTCSRQTLEIAHSAKYDDLRPPIGIIWDYGHVQGIEVYEWRTWWWSWCSCLLDIPLPSVSGYYPRLYRRPQWSNSVADGTVEKYWSTDTTATQDRPKPNNLIFSDGEQRHMTPVHLCAGTEGSRLSPSSTSSWALKSKCLWKRARLSVFMESVSLPCLRLDIYWTGPSH